MYILAEHRMLASVAHDIHSAQISYRAQHGVRAVEQCHLALVVWLLVVGDDNVQTSLVSREVLLHLLYSHIVRLLDYPEVEALSLHHEVVLVANLLLDFVDGVAWETRNDTVYECCAYEAMVGKPSFESLVVCTHVLFPEFDILVDAFLEMVSVKENKLAWHKDKSFLWVTVEEFVAMEEQLYEFTGIAGCWCVCKLAFVIECDACLCSV